MTQIGNTAMKIIGMEVKQQYNKYEQSVLKCAHKILAELFHVLHSGDQLLLSDKRYRLPNCRLNWFISSFVLSFISIRSKTEHKRECQSVCNYKMWPYVASSLTMLLLSCYCYTACIYLLINKCSTKEPKTNVPNVALNSLI